jgi:predicted transcriptional regulator
MNKILVVRIGSPQADVSEFQAAWQQAAQGKEVKASACLTFESLNGWLESLTPARWRLLAWLRKQGPMTTECAAQALGKSDVAAELKVLESLSLIRCDNGQYTVPWDEIEAHMRLAA